ELREVLAVIFARRAPEQRLAPCLDRVGADHRVLAELDQHRDAVRPGRLAVDQYLAQRETNRLVVGRGLRQPGETVLGLLPAARRAGQCQVVFDAETRRRRTAKGLLVLLDRLGELPALRELAGLAELARPDLAGADRVFEVGDVRVARRRLLQPRQRVARIRGLALLNLQHAELVKPLGLVRIEEQELGQRLDREVGPV